MIPKNKIKSAAKYASGSNSSKNIEELKCRMFELGSSFAEKELEDLAVEFANYLFLYRQNSLGEWKHQNRNKIIKTTQELFEIFKKEKYEHEY